MNPQSSINTVSEIYLVKLMWSIFRAYLNMLKVKKLIS